jgi:hypothetical protein
MQQSVVAESRHTENSPPLPGRRGADRGFGTNGVPVKMALQREQTRFRERSGQPRGVQRAQFRAFPAVRTGLAYHSVGGFTY